MDYFNEITLITIITSIVVNRVNDQVASCSLRGHLKMNWCVISVEDLLFEESPTSRKPNELFICCFNCLLYYRTYR